MVRGEGPSLGTSARRHAVLAALVWAVLTLVGVGLVLAFPLFPRPASREGEVIDHAFLVLLLASVPVFTLVQVVLVYSALRFRAGRDDGDGPPIAERPALSGAWVGVSLLMVLALAAFGWAGMEELRPARPVDLTVRVVGSQFAWRFEYPELGVGSTELRLPKDRLVRLELSSRDVLHSFWVPEFRVKQDAVPGRTIAITMTATELGEWNLLCAELCGLGHTVMKAPVRVVDQAAFEQWVAARKAAAR